MADEREQLNIKEYKQSKELIAEISEMLERGEIMSTLILCELTDGDLLGATSATQDQYKVAGYMMAWAMRRMGFTTFKDVRMMISEATK